MKIHYTDNPLASRLQLTTSLRSETHLSSLGD
jgi:hypothetical protein